MDPINEIDIDFNLVKQTGLKTATIIPKFKLFDIDFNLVKQTGLKTATVIPHSTVIDLVGVKSSNKVITYKMRGWDTIGNYVFWESTNIPDLAPMYTTTLPPVKGNLLNPVILGSY